MTEEKMKTPAIVVTAPGKVILFGEHAVVYGKTALAASIEKRMKVKLFHFSNNTVIKLVFTDFNYSKEWSVDELNSFIGSCKVCENEVKESKLNENLVLEVKKFLKLTSTEHSQSEMAIMSFVYLMVVIYHDRALPGMTVEVQSSLPPGAGLGSSAAYLVCLAGALLADTNAIQLVCPKDFTTPIKPSEDDLMKINSYALLTEHLFHGKPSGIDNLVSVYGSVMTYSGRGLFKLIKNMPEIKVVVVDTNITRSTKTQVDKVRQKVEKYPNIINPLFDAIHGVTERGASIFESLAGNNSMDPESRAVLNDLLDMNHMFLNALGVGHSRIEEVIGVLSKFAIHSKLTGAGGGGSVIGLVPPDFPEDSITRMMEACQSLGFTCYLTSLGTSGVTLYKS